uniref:separase n=1 Tax=Dunaliella tertiolecta TaxID=3047 RepID=A0A7S3QRU2_DUNTE|eukprot:CAMPEP_0202404152 /NCGR_PEP_ID=MMETSP1128-20130828/5468_1 /ASSEMBLY_ACC=CAM_ASM_000463 /TAXON_ID=3047 /ORGANISM="Dunaliella tertiolecta, Strain CCMP1320" /LENGTH=442 /DNA_ID=CAMNT_0049008573 /DNA_START=86 /DNA_END=1417 /DNA_ORIENTATION=+
MSTAAAVAVCGDVVEEVSSTGAGSRGGRKKSSRLNSMQHHEDRAEVGAGRAGDKQPSKSRSGITAAPATVEPTTTQQALPSSAGAPAAEASATAAAASAELGSGDGSSRGPVLLVLQHALHALPWEGMPGLQATHTDLYRTPCLPVAAASAACLHAARAPAGLHHAAATHSEDAPGGEVASGKRGRSRAKSGTSSKSRELAQAGGGSQAGSQQQDGQDGTSDAAAVIDLHSTYFVLNPGGDLADTQACFQAWFADQLGWQGVSGHPPSPKDLTAALQSHAMFVYFGHGSGEQYLPLASLRRLHSCAANLLMGCSSGRLRLHGSYDPAGAVWSLLLAGCPAVVANLWDVTDRDIDRFSQALLKTWMGDEMDAEHEGRSSATAQRAKVVQEGERKGGSAARAQQQVGKRSISAAMSSSRGACRLPHLIGAAPVCYGLPTSVAWN